MAPRRTIRGTRLESLFPHMAHFRGFSILGHPGGFLFGAPVWFPERQCSLGTLGVERASDLREAGPSGPVFPFF
jgi:hypothetical protein